MSAVASRAAKIVRVSRSTPEIQPPLTLELLSEENSALCRRIFVFDEMHDSFDFPDFQDSALLEMLDIIE